MLAPDHIPIYKSQDEIGPAMNISEIAQQLEQLEKLAEESDDVADILKDELIQTSYGNDKSGNSLFPYQLSSTRTLLTTLWHPGLHRLYRK
ncbi:unnamed protein product [Toxocara canis]|uniref:Charged multivesicular body protein 7 n=1 Tax=Toxocara canis TaxID=6265 RepID=A0A183UXE3_TOXCA|nr:unnamed protein product [Toxocara canis]